MLIESSRRYRFGHPVGRHLLQAFLSWGARHRLILQVALATKPKVLAQPLFVELILLVLTWSAFWNDTFSIEQRKSLFADSGETAMSHAPRPLGNNAEKLDRRSF